MSLINKFECCRGLTIFKWNKLRIEIWYIPSGYTIIEHSHPDENVELIHVIGKSTFFRRDVGAMSVSSKTDKAQVPFFSWFKKFSVRCFHSHWFTTCKTPMIFINVQRFLPWAKVQSASKDFKVTYFK